MEPTQRQQCSVLYISYDGLTDPLGQSQVLSYLEKLAVEGYDIHILSYEKPQVFEEKKNEISVRTTKAHIQWHPLPYTKSPPILSTLYDLFKGWQVIKQLRQKTSFNIVHCRGYMSAILGRKMKKQYGTKFIFDMRGWWADEKRESGLWNSPLYVPVYRYFKHLEERFFKESEVSVSLTFAGQEEIQRLGFKNKEQVEVIPTCVNFNYFPPFSSSTRSEYRKKLKIEDDALVLVYSGSLGGNYNPDILFRTFRYLQKANGKWQLLILSKCDKKLVNDAIQRFSITTNKVHVASCDYTEVSNYLMTGDAGFIFYSKTYSVIGRSPTKMAEYWSAGLPVVSLKGIGDMDYLLNRYPEGGFLLDEITEDNCRELDKKLLTSHSNRDLLYEYARQYFDLDRGVAKYKALYQTLC
ncbi:MAG: glycosyltransferase [Chitinophagales bacterium]|nr:glycosyltransferase [Chitinophagales bacterium]